MAHVAFMQSSGIRQKGFRDPRISSSRPRALSLRDCIDEGYAQGFALLYPKGPRTQIRGLQGPDTMELMLFGP